MARLNLLTVNIIPDSSVKELDKLFPGAGAEVLDYLKNLSRDLQGASEASFKSYVPFYTGELRNSQIQSKDKGTTKKVGFTVFVLDTTHRNTPGRKKIKGAELARILDEGIDKGRTLHRRKDAVGALHRLISPTPPGRRAKTANWIGDAINTFEKALGKI